MANLVAIEAAIKSLKCQKDPNIERTVGEFGVNRITLSRHFRGVQKSKEAFHESRSHMTQHQQQSLISYINLLTNRGTPPTNAMVHCFIKEITGIDIRKNYIT